MAASKPKVLFVLTVDTEEEWDWSGPFPNDNFSVRNTFELPAFQNFCNGLGIKPTYLVDYAIANNNEAVKIINGFSLEQCEIGAHLHPWANPPFIDETSDFSSHVINLPIEQVNQKLIALVDLISDKFSVKPKTFRTGRWGINGEVLKLLVEQGITTDSSIYPLYSNEYFTCEWAERTPYWPSYSDTNKPGQQREIFEIPVTCGFNRSNTQLAQLLHKTMEKPPFRWLRINGLLWHSLLLRKIYLSPELCTSSDMKRLINARLKKKDTVFHMYMHSSSLVQQVTGLNNEPHAREHLCQRIAETIEHLQQKADVEFVTLSEASAKLTDSKQGDL